MAYPIFLWTQRIFCLPLFLCCFLSGLAQESEKQKLVQELNAISEHYRGIEYLSFDIGYKYSNEQQPGAYLDTLIGSFKISGGNYWYRLDNTEAIGNNDLLLMLFKEDQIIYLTKPSSFSVYQKPLDLIDSLLKNNDIISSSIRTVNKQRKIVLRFKAGMKYKSIEYDIDESSGFILKMRCIVGASALYELSVKSLLENENTYAVIEAEFTNYQKTAFSSDQFNLTKYFKKEGDEYIALPPYENYKIFLGTTHLQ